MFYIRIRNAPFLYHVMYAHMTSNFALDLNRKLNMKNIVFVFALPALLNWCYFSFFDLFLLECFAVYIAFVLFCLCCIRITGGSLFLFCIYLFLLLFRQYWSTILLRSGHCCIRSFFTYRHTLLRAVFLALILVHAFSAHLPRLIPLILASFLLIQVYLHVRPLSVPRAHDRAIPIHRER